MTVWATPTFVICDNFIVSLEARADPAKDFREEGGLIFRMSPIFHVNLFIEIKYKNTIKNVKKIGLGVY